jgi:hypothetical protein
MLDERSIRNETKIGRKLQDHVPTTPSFLILQLNTAVKRKRLVVPMVHVEGSLACLFMSEIVY